MGQGNHIFVAAASGAAALLVIVFLLVLSRAAPPVSERAVAWTRGETYFFDASRVGAIRNAKPNAPEEAPPFGYTSYIPFTPQTKRAADTGDDANEATFSFSKSRSYGSTEETAENESATGALDDVYSLMPRGLIAVSEPKTRTVKETGLYEYGNAVGAYIETYDQSYGRQQTAILTGFYADRNDPQKQERVRELGLAIARVGKAMENMNETPAAISGMHANLAGAYEKTGLALQDIASAKEDADLLARVEAYNKQADSFISAFVALALYFEAARISFSPSDPGRAFVFSPAPQF